MSPSSLVFKGKRKERWKDEKESKSLSFSNCIPKSFLAAKSFYKLKTKKTIEIYFFSSKNLGAQGQLIDGS